VATKEAAPYRAVLTHGFICNETGEVLSKSLKNFVPPRETIDQQGAEILRLWVGYEDYRADIVFSPGILKSLVESYRKIRNTFRFMLGNLHGFDPVRDAMPMGELEELDRWMLARLARYVERVDRAYDGYNFHHVFHRTIDLVTVELSSFYLDIIKDRLYCELPGGTSRRSAQTVLYALARDMARALSPVLSFTAEEVWQHLPGDGNRADSVFLAGFPAVPDQWRDEALLERWSVIRDVRRAVTKVLEGMRRDGAIGNSLQSRVTVRADGEVEKLLRALGEEAMADVCLVSSLAVEKGAGEVEVSAARSDDPKCPRCWRLGHGVGADPARPELCERCAEVVKQMIAAGDLEL
jgi:isoleucyl-tRNA synthetase